MKKIISIIMLVLVLCLTLQIVSADIADVKEEFEVMVEEMGMDAMGERMIAPYPGGGDGFGQNHYYSVLYDGEGDAIVAAKLTFQNTGKENLTEISIEIPGIEVRMINALQEVQRTEKYCIQWEDICTEHSETTGKCIEYKRQCANWRERQSWPPYYYTIEKIENKLSKSTQYTLTFPEQITEQQVGTVLLYYKVHGDVEKTMGSWKFDFETIKFNQDINNIRVAVNVQEDLILQGGEAEVDYRSGFALMEKSAGMMAEDAVQSNELQQFSSQISNQRGFVKNAQGLDPLESFHVKGKYSSSKFLLYKGRIFAGIILSLLLIGGTVLGLRKLSQIRMGGFVTSLIAGGLSAAGIIVVWVIFGFIINNLNRWIGYQFGDLMALLLILLGAIITLALLVGPALYIGLKKGIAKGFLVFGTTLVTLILLAIIIVLFLAILGTGVSPRYY